MCYITFRATKTGVTKLNVICVDDSRLTLFSLRRKIGCIVPEARVAACHNAKQAVDSARKNGCDVLLRPEALTWPAGSGKSIRT